MATLEDLTTLIGAEQGLAVVSTTRADGTVQASLVNAGVLPHPVTGEDAVAFVTYGKVKLTNLRERPSTAITIRSGWRWCTAEGPAQIIGPDDPDEAVDAERLRLLLREIFAAAGGTHDDWPEYDSVMREQRRAAVFVRPGRVYGN